MEPDVFEKALVYAMQKHHGMRRKAEDIPYLLHPMEVATIAASMTNDPDILAACCTTRWKTRKHHWLKSKLNSVRGYTAMSPLKQRTNTVTDRPVRHGCSVNRNRLPNCETLMISMSKSCGSLINWQISEHFTAVTKKRAAPCGSCLIRVIPPSRPGITDRSEY